MRLNKKAKQPSTPRHKNPMATIMFCPEQYDYISRRAYKKSSTLNQIIERYAELCRRHLPSFSEEEWKLICCALDRKNYDKQTCAVIEHYIADKIASEQLETKFDVDSKTLLKKLSVLPYAAKVATVDAAEQYQIRIARGETAHLPIREIP